jgi:hypothetical protein
MFFFFSTAASKRNISVMSGKNIRFGLVFVLLLCFQATRIQALLVSRHQYCHFYSTVALQRSNTGRSSFQTCRFAKSLGNDNDNDADLAQRIMYNQQARQRESIRYQIIAAEACEPLAMRMARKYPDRFTFHPTVWGKFPDGTDNIEIGGFTPVNVISGEHVLFLASFHNNDVTLSQFQVMICLLQSFIESLTVVLPFSPVGTMERVIREGQVATAATYAHSKSMKFIHRKCVWVQWPFLRQHGVE